MERKKQKEKELQYQKIVQNKTPKPNYLMNSLRAFWVGGVICSIGQVILDIATKNGAEKVEAGTIEIIIMIFLGAFLTGLGIYDKIGRYAGAGSIVPITGFANSIVSPAMEFKREGFVFGVGAKMFVLAGPVLVYGITSSVIVGLIYFIFGAGR